MTLSLKKLAATTALAGLALALSACNATQRLEELGSPPSLSAVSTPQAIPVSFPVPEPETHVHQANSLWQSGARAFFKDQRAAKVGDIMTVIISLNDKADLKNETTRQRTTSESDGGNVLGVNNLIKKLVPYGAAVDPSKLIDINSTNNHDGKGEVNRQDQVNTRVAAVVTQVLPNGNMVIYGKQEMVVNFEMREIKIAGVIRPEDIGTENTINYDQVAEARITYGGRGNVMDVQQQRYGEQLLDVILPF